MRKIKEVLRKQKNNNLALKYIWNEYRRHRENKNYSRFNDYDAITNMYQERLSRPLNLITPELFTEKLQWIKLFYRSDLMTQCVDKYGVREYVKQCDLEGILNPLIGVYDNVKEINYRQLPDKFVLKGTHGSGWVAICKDKENFPIRGYNRIMNSWMKQNIYYSGREWPYDKVPHRIVCEKYIESKDDLKDYKIFCFSGKPQYIQVDGDRLPGEHSQAFYDLDWNKMQFRYGEHDDCLTGCPNMLREMLKVAEILSKPFPFARVDLYNVEEKIIFGEITFFPDCGFAKFDPPDVDRIFGEQVTLPAPNYNLDLLEQIKNPTES